jgi:hypothetical protein
MFTARRKSCRVFLCGARYGAAEQAAEKIVGSAEAFRACVGAVGLGWRAQPGMAVPREGFRRL